MPAETWSALLSGFFIFLVLTAIAGYISGFHLLVSACRYQRLRTWLLFSWGSLPVILLFAWMLKQNFVGSRSAYLVMLGVSMSFFAIAASAAADRFEDWLERRADIYRRSFFRIATRTLVVIYSIVALAAAGGMVKATAHHADLAHYSFSPELKKILKIERLKEVGHQPAGCTRFLEVISERTANYVYMHKPFLSYFRFWSNVRLSDRSGTQYTLKFSRSFPTKEQGTIIIVNVEYEDELGNECRTLVRNGGKAWVDGKIERTVLISSIKPKINYYTDLADAALHDPPSVLAFAFVSTYEELGGMTLSLIPEDGAACQLQTVTKLSALFLVVVVFYILKPKSSTQQTNGSRRVQ